MQPSCRNRGFSFPELIVVISLTTILVGVLLLAINPQSLLAKSRDAQRFQELEILNKAISLAVNEGEIVLGDYGPNPSVQEGLGTGVDGNGYVQFIVPEGNVGLAKYLGALPVDPINGVEAVGGKPLFYVFKSSPLGWELNAVLEASDNAFKMSTDGGNQSDVYELGTLLNLIGPVEGEQSYD